MSGPPLAPPSARVDLGAIVRNAQRLAARADGRQVLAAVKADAYGHGAVPVARALAASGVAWFGVATAAEALDLRSAGIVERILVFGPLTDRPDVAAAAVTAGIDLTVTDALSVARAANLAEHASGPQPVHLKLDTGMGRIGAPAADAVRVARSVAARDRLELAAVWTHLAVADDPSQDDRTRAQLAAFDAALADLASAGLRPPLAHAANTAGVTRIPASRYDLVRPGIGLYGYHASPRAAAAAVASGLELEPALCLEAPVTFVKRVAAGATVSYGATWTADVPTTVATVRLGYADGYLRALSNRATAAIGEHRVRVTGRVCMDQTMVALPEGAALPAVGDRAVLMGGDAPDAAALAALAGTIPYELLVRIGSRVERSYANMSAPPKGASGAEVS